jgi:hypothetical protein
MKKKRKELILKNKVSVINILKTIIEENIKKFNIKYKSV